MATFDNLEELFAKELAYQKEASELEGVLVLLPCQTEIIIRPDDERMGVEGYCRKGKVCFWDQSYMSKKRIQDTCREHCTFHNQK